VYLLLDLWMVAGDAAVVMEAAKHADGVVDSSVIGGHRVTGGKQHSWATGDVTTDERGSGGYPRRNEGSVDD
jgi:hypothetical protein